MYNTIVAAGYLASDPEIREVGDAKVCKIRLCISPNRAKEPCFMDAELWNKQAEIANEYLKKGRAIILQGEVRQSSWESEGKKYSKTFIAGNSFQFINGGDSDSTKSQSKETASVGADEEIPF